MKEYEDCGHIILLRVRFHHQVLIDPLDRRFQYILWRNSEEEEIR